MVSPKKDRDSDTAAATERTSVQSYREWIADFLAAHAYKTDHGGYQAFRGRLKPGTDTFIAERNIHVHVRAVICKWPQDAHPRVPSLWFLVCNAGIKRFDSFALETELVIEALENVDPATQLPIPAYEVGDVGNDFVLAAGADLDLRMSPVRIEAPAPDSAMPRFPVGGIRFALGEAREVPAYSFAMAGVTPFLALANALEAYAGPSSFALELDEFEQELESTPDDL